MTELWTSNMATGCLRSSRRERKVDWHFIECICFHPSVSLHQFLLFLSLPPVKSSMLFFRTWQQWRLREGWVTPGDILVVCVCNLKSNSDGAAESLRCFLLLSLCFAGDVWAVPEEFLHPLYRPNPDKSPKGYFLFYCLVCIFVLLIFSLILALNQWKTPGMVE